MLVLLLCVLVIVAEGRIVIPVRELFFFFDLGVGCSELAASE
jgi:hypothetical protein